MKDMGKRFFDTDKYRKQFFKGLPAPYKLFWDYLLCTCDFAGVWYVEMDVAQLYLGRDAKIERETALALFNADKIRVIEFNGGKNWFLTDFIPFQYGILKKTNPAHRGVIARLQSLGLQEIVNFEEGAIEVLERSFEGPKDKDKEKEKEKDKEKDKEVVIETAAESDSNSSSESSESTDVTEVVLGKYHELCPSLPRVMKLTASRKSSIRVRLREIGSVEKVVEMLQKVEASDFLTGRGRNSFRASFDWIFCAKGNWVKVVEGNYDNKDEVPQLAVGQVIGTHLPSESKLRQKLDF